MTQSSLTPPGDRLRPHQLQDATLLAVLAHQPEDRCEVWVANFTGIVVFSEP